ncbi:hypothetical protein ACFYUD_34540 [Nocardia tengchongensis]|uniref:hypothetical protein n=1 Tax=Nocardia tengchongensis TaxID=2055889 RepID=UPI0036A0E96D
MSDTAIHTTDVTVEVSAVDQLANNILANPEIASHYLDPAGVIVELAARVRHLRTRLEAVTRNGHVTGEQLTEMRAACRNLTADNERLTDAALWYAGKLGITGPAPKASR